MKRLQDIDLKLLRSFKAIVDAGGITGAQATLNCSQSTLSTQLADLEKRLGFRVCKRGRSGFSVTPEGKKLLAALEDLFSAADRFQNATATISGDLRGVLRIGIMDAMLANTAWPLPNVLGRFSERAPDTHVDLSLISPSTMETQILEGQQDVVIGPFPQKRSGLEYIPLFQERHSLYAVPHHPLTKLPHIGFEELSQHSLIVTPGELQRFPFIRKDKRKTAHAGDGSITSSATVDQMETHAILIRSGRFVGFLPDYYGASLPNLVALKTGPELQYFSPIYLAYRKNAEHNIILRSFINRVREQPLLTDHLVQSGAVVPLGK
ncbi:LysR family transcriptional regulator [Shimia sp. R11_0]|uniref:LysR family transcriptional regulator n=1 Tax=Shimia sp. R11_0 TaxID=2821096 RepID=UPI001ADB49FE|nr:LysR family transcriptional regulator [Shimia sp. R11_0]MBO9477275.1 LysR family transcriptional regulator [Shimia sp. R11_0]